MSFLGSCTRYFKLGSSQSSLTRVVQRMRHATALRHVVLYGAGGVFVAWCFYGFRHDIARISFDSIWTARNAVCLAASLSLLNYLMRVIRWSSYLGQFGYRFPESVNVLRYLAGFAFTLSPGKAGEMVRAHYYKRAGVPLAVTTAAFFVERLMDTLAVASLAFIGLAASSGYAGALWVSMIVLLCLLLILAAAPWGRWQTKLADQQDIPVAIRNGLEGAFRIFISARQLLRPGPLAFGFFLGLLAWGAEGTGLMVLGNLAPSVPIDWATANGIYAIAVLVGALSFLPGGLGSTEVVMASLLAAHGYAMPQALLITMVCRILTLWLAVMIGWSAVLVLRHFPEQVPIES
jgi:uncharacterized protein (TIRG00374 family)